MTRRILAAGAAIVVAALATAAGMPADAPEISVEEAGHGRYVVAARFSVPESADTVRAVLTDYANIPRFVPGVRSSQVLERQPGYARVEQEAVSKFMLFSKRVHLVLDVDEAADGLRFRDRCHRSFTYYEGAWTMARRGDRTEVRYLLSAQPAFSVPGFVLRQLLNRDAAVMIDRLRREITARARRTNSED